MVTAALLYDYLEDGPKSYEDVETYLDNRGGNPTQIDLNTKIMSREGIMKNTVNKQRVCQLLCTFDYGPDITMVGRAESLVKHDEADITLVSYMLEAAKGGARVI